MIKFYSLWKLVGNDCNCNVPTCLQQNLITPPLRQILVAAHRRFICIQNFIFWNDQVASHRWLAAPKRGCSPQVLFTTVLQIILIYSHFVKPYSDIICWCCIQYLDIYVYYQNSHCHVKLIKMSYRQANVIYIHYNSMLWGISIIS